MAKVLQLLLFKKSNSNTQFRVDSDTLVHESKYSFTFDIDGFHTAVTLLSV